MTVPKTFLSKPFKYGKSHKIIYWGCSFDSLLELKFALSVQSEYEFLRSNIIVYFDPKTKCPTDYIRANIRRYTPDFLIRHKETNKAFWIEIKPRAFSDHAQLALRKEVAERYIQWKGYDWEYKVVYDDEIKLTLDQLVQFNECCVLIPKSARKIWFEKYNKRFDRSTPSLFFKAPENSRIRFVMYGQKSSLKKFS
jgi:hypothetical protein